MNDIRKEFLEILAGIRAHLEYQRALGIGAIELPAAAGPERSDREGNSAAPPAPQLRPAADRTDAAKPAMAALVPAKTAVAPSLGDATLEAIRDEIGDCRRCKLEKGRKTIVFGEGNPQASILFVGEGPGFEEDQQGRPFVGAAGQLLTDIIVKGMKLMREDVYICNIVKCRPPGNRNPEPDEVDACIGFVMKQIRTVGPKVIVTLGNVPTQNLLGTKQGITKMRGTWQEYEGIPVMPTFHPSYLLRSPGEKKHVWADIQQVMKKLGMPVLEKK